MALNPWKTCAKLQGPRLKYVSTRQKRADFVWEGGEGGEGRGSGILEGFFRRPQNPRRRPEARRPMIGPGGESPILGPYLVRTPRPKF